MLIIVQVTPNIREVREHRLLKILISHNQLRPPTKSQKTHQIVSLVWCSDEISLSFTFGSVRALKLCKNIFGSLIYFGHSGCVALRARQRCGLVVQGWKQICSWERQNRQSWACCCMENYWCCNWFCDFTAGKTISNMKKPWVCQSTNVGSAEVCSTKVGSHLYCSPLLNKCFEAMNFLLQID